MKVFDVAEGATLSSAMVAKLVRVPRRTLHSWIAKGVVVPDIREVAGRGPDSGAIFSTAGLLRAAAATYLIRDMGISWQTAKRWLDKWEEKPGYRAPIKDSFLEVSLCIGFLQEMKK